MNLIANKIIETRKTKGITQEELAELSQVNLRTILSIQTGRTQTSGSHLPQTKPIRMHIILLL